MSPSGPPVTMYCMRADAPGRSGWLSASFLLSSSHSWVSHFGIVTPPRRVGLVESGRSLAARLSAHEVAHTGEQIVLRRGRIHQRAGPDVVVVGMDAAGHLRRQSEPERRVGVDLGGMGQKRLAAD